jgi:hypothetical protein
MKRTVQYIGKATALPYYSIDGKLDHVRALLIPLDHESPLVMNDAETITSAVQNWDQGTGRIETQNSIYLPVPLPTIEEMDAATTES